MTLKRPFLATGNTVLDCLIRKIGAVIFRLLLLALLAILVFQGRSLANALISQNPDVIGAKIAVVAAQAAAAEAQAAAANANKQAVQLLATQEKIFIELQSVVIGQQAIATDLSGIKSTVVGYGTQLNRVEDRINAHIDAKP